MSLRHLLPLLVLWHPAAGDAQSVVYTRTGGEMLTLAKVPAGPGPHPAVLLLGAAGLAPSAAAAGFAAFTITHRPAAYPDALEDVRRAVRFLRSGGAPNWKVDARRIGLIGYSREGLLSSLAGLSPAPSSSAPATAATTDPTDRISAAVQAVVSIAAPSDFRQPGFAHTEPEAWSPVLHIASAVAPPPYLLIHGDADTEVPLTQSAHLQNALQAAGIRCNLIIVPGGGHQPSEWNPARRDWMGEMFAWLAQVLAVPNSKRRQ